MALISRAGVGVGRLVVPAIGFKAPKIGTASPYYHSSETARRVADHTDAFAIDRRGERAVPAEQCVENKVHVLRSIEKVPRGPGISGIESTIPWMFESGDNESVARKYLTKRALVKPVAAGTMRQDYERPPPGSKRRSAGHVPRLRPAIRQ